MISIGNEYEDEEDDRGGDGGLSISSCELKARTWHLAGQVFLNSALYHIVSVCASTTYDYNVISTRKLSCNAMGSAQI